MIGLEPEEVELINHIRELKESLLCNIELRKDYYDKLVQIVKYNNENSKSSKKLDKPEQFLEWFINDLYQYLKEEGKI